MKKTVFDNLKSVPFYDLRQKKCINSAKLKDALFNLPKTIPKILNIPSAAIGNLEDSYEEISDNDLEGQRKEKLILPFNADDLYTRLDVLLRVKRAGHTNFRTESFNLIDEFYKRSEIQNEQEYRTALDNFHTQQMELPIKILEQIVIITRRKIEEHLLSDMVKSTHEGHLYQLLETVSNQFKKPNTSLSGYHGFLIVIKSKKILCQINY